MRAIRYLFFVLLFLSYVLQGVSASQDAIKQLEMLLQKNEVTDQDKRAVERLLTGLSRMTDGTSRQAAERFGYRWKIKLLESEGPKATRDVAELQVKEQELRELIAALGAQSVDEAKKKIAESKLFTDQKIEQITKNTQELGMIQQENTVLKKSVEELKKSLEQEKKTKEEVQIQARQAEERAVLSQGALNNGKQDLDATKAQLKICQDGLAGRGEMQQKLVLAQQNIEEQIKKMGEVTQDKESFKIKFEQAQQQLIALTAEKEKALQQAAQAEQKVTQCQSSVDASQQSTQTTNAALKKAQDGLAEATNQLKQCRTDLTHQQELRKQLAMAQQELESAKSSMVTSNAENAQLQQQIQQRQTDLDTALAEKVMLSKGLQGKESELATCTSKLAHQQTLETQLNALKAELQEEKTRTATLGNARVEVERQLTLLSQEKNALTSKLEERNRAAEIATSELAACRTDLANQDALKKQLADAQKALREKEVLVKGKEAIEAELARQKQHVAAAKKEVEEINKNLIACKSQAAEQNKLYEQRLGVLQRDLENTKTGRAEIMRENSVVKAELERIKNTVEANQREKTELQQKLHAANNTLTACQTGLADCENIKKQIVQFERDLKQAQENAEVTNKAKIAAEKQVVQLQSDLEKSRSEQQLCVRAHETSLKELDVKDRELTATKLELTAAKTAQQSAELELKNVKAAASKPIGFGTGAFGGGAVGKLPMISSECDNKLTKIRQALSYYNRTKRGLFYKVEQLQGFIEQYIDPIAQGRALAQDIEDLIKSEQVQ